MIKIFNREIGWNKLLPNLSVIYKIISLSSLEKKKSIID